MKFLAATLLVFISSIGVSQTRALFLGNSYTNYNNLPQMVSDLADSAGEELIVDKNTPGGYTFNGHTTNATSQAKIEEGNWDFVVLQEQSQLPSFSENQYQAESFVYAETLNTQILESNPCAETMFYMTWGRENGDAGNCPFIPEVCTYEGMDDRLAERYQFMAEELEGVVSPVGRVWRNLRDNDSEIQLYTGDGSHPSLAGSYAAAVCFYTCIFRADPTELTENLGVNASEAEEIRQAVHEVVYVQLANHLIGEYDINPSYEVETEGSQMTFTNTTEGETTSLEWIFNGESYDEESPSVQFNPENISVTVELIVSDDCGSFSSGEGIITALNTSEISRSEIIFYPNPAMNEISFSEEISEIRVVDSMGKEVFQYSELTNNLDINFLNNGVYLLSFDKNGKKNYFRFQKI